MSAKRTILFLTLCTFLIGSNTHCSNSQKKYPYFGPSISLLWNGYKLYNWIKQPKNQNTTIHVLGRIENTIEYAVKSNLCNIHSACTNNDSKLVSILLDSHVNPNEKDNAGDTPLHIACNNKNLSIVKKLIEANANPNIRNKFGDTPLHIACKSKDLSIVEELIKAKADPNKQNKKDRNTPLHIACGISENSSIAKELIKAKANPNIRNKLGNTPLHVASTEGNGAYMLSDLIKAGIKLNAQNRLGDTALHLACEKNYGITAKALTKAGANPTIKNRSGKTALDTAFCNKHVDIVDFLIQDNSRAEADFVRSLTEFQTNFDKNSSLHTAYEKGCMSVIRALFKAGVTFNAYKYWRPQLSLLSPEKRRILIESIVPFKTNAKNKNSNYPVIASQMINLLHETPIYKPAQIIPLLKRAIKQYKGQNVHTRLVITPQLTKQLDLLQLALDPSDKQLAKDTRYFYNNLGKFCEFLKKKMKNRQGYPKNDINIYFGNGPKPKPNHNPTVSFEELDIVAPVNTNQNKPLHNINTFTQSNLHIACEKGDITLVTSLLKHPSYSPDEKNSSGETPLQLACKNGHIEIVKLLIKFGATNPNNKDNAGKTPLHLACANNHIAIVEELIKAKAKLNEKDRAEAPFYGGETPLHIACDKGHLAIVKKLIKAGADLNTTEKYKETPLFKASWNGHVKIVKMLLKAGADKELADSTGRTPLCVACAQDHLNIVELLLNAGANPNASYMHGSPLHSAIDNPKILKTLLNAGASRTMEGGMFGTPLHWACGNDSNLEAVKILINTSGPGSLFEFSRNFITGLNLQKSYEQETALYHACLSNCPKIVAVLLEAGADPNIPESSGYTPLYWACWHNNLDIIDGLISAGADLNAANKYSTTPLLMACENGQLEAVNRLIKAKAKLNSVNKKKQTSVELALLKDRLDIVKVLAEAGATLDISNSQGETILHRACEKGNIDLVDTLIETNVNLNKTDEKGQTPLHKACINGHLNIVNVLIESGDVKLNVNDFKGFTAYDYATNCEIRGALIAAGAKTVHPYQKI
ncbi:TPA: hypothetical protein DDZ86_01490 [Candidatus Dependentiae bacterium]|nr:MAG: hypothetical protein UW09_C0001G0339 [candidate division TM6 bacterium GW2011_GWF2_43_87]HBL98297.1 hypothetical protein [Candidatus Dependentiae bacterium]